MPIIGWLIASRHLTSLRFACVALPAFAGAFVALLWAQSPTRRGALILGRFDPAMAQTPGTAPRPARPTPPTRDANAPGYVTAKELPDGATLRQRSTETSQSR